MRNKKAEIYDVPKIENFRDIVDNSGRRYADEVAFLYHDGKSKITEVTYREAVEDIKALATYLNSQGLEGKKIAVSGKNSYGWAITYLAVTCGTGIIVPIDKDLRADEISFILGDSEASAILYGKEMEEKVGNIPEGCKKFSLDRLEEYTEEGKRLMREGDSSYADHKVDNNALGILLYTSGTTGVAKGVMLSQKNICSNIMSVLSLVKLYPYDRSVSVLPLHHTYECMAGFLSFFYSGASIAYNNSLLELQSDLQVFKPTVFVVVPLILESFRNIVIKKYRKIKGGRIILAVQRFLAGLTKSHSARRKIFGAVNKAFGGNMNRVLSGAAALSPDVYKDYELFGLDVYVGYGLTETSPVCIMHNDFYSSPYDIGYPLSGTEAMISDPNADGIGELAVKGPNVMLGYYKNPEETEKVIRDGWFYTGDLAKKTSRGTYMITGRIKSMIVTRNGKKVFPEELENFINQSDYVKESMVYGIPGNGDDDVTVAVSIFPDFELLDEELKKKGYRAGDGKYEAARREIFVDIIKDVNRKFPAYKQVRRIFLRFSEFEKTTTRKIKRMAQSNISSASMTEIS